jgi:hypothetical protein
MVMLSTTGVADGAHPHPESNKAELTKKHPARIARVILFVFIFCLVGYDLQFIYRTF